MTFEELLQRAVEGMPDEGLVTFPVSWLRAQLNERSTADLTVEELAAQLGRAPSTVRTWLGAGRVPGKA